MSDSSQRDIDGSAPIIQINECKYDIQGEIDDKGFESISDFSYQETSRKHTPPVHQLHTLSQADGNHI
jgi:hypothetical protein